MSSSSSSSTVTDAQRLDIEGNVSAYVMMPVIANYGKSIKEVTIHNTDTNQTMMVMKHLLDNHVLLDSFSLLMNFNFKKKDGFVTFLTDFIDDQKRKKLYTDGVRTIVRRKENLKSLTLKRMKRDTYQVFTNAELQRFVHAILNERKLQKLVLYFSTSQHAVSTPAPAENVYNEKGEVIRQVFKDYKMKLFNPIPRLFDELSKESAYNIYLSNLRDLSVNFDEFATIPFIVEAVKKKLSINHFKVIVTSYLENIMLLTMSVLDDEHPVHHIKTLTIEYLDFGFGQSVDAKIMPVQVAEFVTIAERINMKSTKLEKFSYANPNVHDPKVLKTFLESILTLQNKVGEIVITKVPAERKLDNKTRFAIIDKMFFAVNTTLTLDEVWKRSNFEVVPGEDPNILKILESRKTAYIQSRRAWREREERELNRAMKEILDLKHQRKRVEKYIFINHQISNVTAFYNFLNKVITATLNVRRLVIDVPEAASMLRNEHRAMFRQRLIRSVRKFIVIMPELWKLSDFEAKRANQITDERLAAQKKDYEETFYRVQEEKRKSKEPLLPPPSEPLPPLTLPTPPTGPPVEDLFDDLYLDFEPIELIPGSFLESMLEIPQEGERSSSSFTLNMSMSPGSSSSMSCSSTNMSFSPLEEFGVGLSPPSSGPGFDDLKLLNFCLELGIDNDGEDYVLKRQRMECHKR